MFRWVVLILLIWGSLQQVIAQLSIGSYSGEIRAIAAASDTKGDGQLANMDFQIHSNVGWSRCDFMLPALGYLIVITDSAKGSFTSYFEFAGSKKAMVQKCVEADSLTMNPNEFRFELGAFECMDGDTMIAGEPCKKARWYPANGQQGIVEVWYASEIPNLLPKRYVNLLGMPMCFTYWQSGVAMQYRITAVNRSTPDAALFQPLQDHEIILPAEDQRTYDIEQGK
jgi:hypothetical protein